MIKTVIAVNVAKNKRMVFFLIHTHMAAYHDNYGRIFRDLAFIVDESNCRTGSAA